MMEKEMERQSRSCLGENGQGGQADMQDLAVEPLAFILAAPRAPMSDGINLTCPPLPGFSTVGLLILQEIRRVGALPPPKQTSEMLSPSKDVCAGSTTDECKWAGIRAALPQAEPD